MDLVSALKKAKADVAQKEAELEVRMKNTQDVKEDVNPDEKGIIKARAVENFIAEIMNSGYTEFLAREALKKGLDPEKIDEGKF